MLVDKYLQQKGDAAGKAPAAVPPRTPNNTFDSVISNTGDGKAYVSSSGVNGAYNRPEMPTIQWKKVGIVTGAGALAIGLYFGVGAAKQSFKEWRIDSALEGYYEDITERIAEVKEEANERQATQSELASIADIERVFSYNWPTDLENFNYGKITVEGVEEVGDKYLADLDAALANIPEPEERAAFEAKRKAEEKAKAEADAKARAEAKANMEKLANERAQKAAAEREEQEVAKAKKQHADYMPYWDKQLAGYNKAKADAAEMGLEFPDAPPTPSIDGLTTSKEIYAENQKIVDFVKGNSISTIRAAIRKKQREIDNAKYAAKKELDRANNLYNRELKDFEHYSNQRIELIERLAKVGIAAKQAKPLQATIDGVTDPAAIIAASKKLKDEWYAIYKENKELNNKLARAEKEQRRELAKVQEITSNYEKAAAAYVQIRKNLFKRADKFKRYPLIRKHVIAGIPAEITVIDFAAKYPTYSDEAVNVSNDMVVKYLEIQKFQQVGVDRIVKLYNEDKLK